VSSILSGIPGYAIEDVKLSNIYIETVGGATAEDAQVQPPEFENKYPEPGMFGAMPASGFFLRHMRNVEMSHVEIANATPDARPAFYLTDVERADFFAVTAPRNAGRSFCAAWREGPAHRLEPGGCGYNAEQRRQQDAVSGRDSRLGPGQVQGLLREAWL
jgi:hypothetical protein